MAPRGSAGPANCGGSEDFRDVTAEARASTPEALNAPRRAPKTGCPGLRVFKFEKRGTGTLMRQFALPLVIAFGRHVQPNSTAKLARYLASNSKYPGRIDHSHV